MKVAPRRGKENPREAKLTRGASRARSKPPLLRRTGRRSKALKAGSGDWRDRATGRRDPAQTTRGQRRATSPHGFLSGETPEERTLDVVAGRNKPAKFGRGASRRGREKRRGRNEAGLGRPRAWTLLNDAAMRDESPGKELGFGRAGVGSRDSAGADRRTRG